MTDEEFKTMLERAKQGGHVVGAQMAPIRCVVFNDANGLWKRVFPSEEAFIACLEGEAQQAGLEAENAAYVAGGGSTGRGPSSKKGLSKYQAKQAARRLREDEETEREEKAEKADHKKAYHHKWYKEHYKPVSVDGRWLRGAIRRSKEWADSLDQAGRLVGRPAASDHPSANPPRQAVPVTGEPGHRQRKFGLRGPNF